MYKPLNTTTMKKVLKAVIGILAALALLILVGEKAPEVSGAYFWGVKAGALAYLVAAGYILKAWRA
jgi:hypothetical protein